MGVVFIALFVAFHATKQLRLLESMAQKVVADGALPRIPEEGTAEIKATARALNRMGDSIKRLIDSKMRLVAAAGHDLRTPMTRMRLRAEFLDDEARADWLRDLDEMDRIADSAIQLVREETTSQGLRSSRSMSLSDVYAMTCRRSNYPWRWGAFAARRCRQLRSL